MTDATEMTAAAVFEGVLRRARDVLGAAIGLRAVATPSVYALVGLHQVFRDARAYGLSVQGAPGLIDYAKTALADPDYDILATFAGMLTTGALVTDWITTNIQNDGAGNYLGWRLVGGDFSGATLDADAAQALGPLLDALTPPLQRLSDLAA